MGLKEKKVFFWSDFSSMYCKEMIYTVRANNHALRAAVEGWVAERSVVLLDSATPSAQITAIGTVQLPAHKPSFFERIKSWL